jgi:hypothetical protein
MNLFQFVEDVEAGQFFVSAVHDGSNVINIAIYPIVDDIVYPALLMELQSMQPLIDMIERKLVEAA